MSTPLHLMVDLETVSTEDNAGIISMAAVPFAFPIHIEPFYMLIDFTSLEPKGFHLSQSTLDWWQKQPATTRTEAFSGVEDVAIVLAKFKDWVDSISDNTRLHIWGNGATFDNVILRNALDRVGVPVPWRYTEDRCYRTLKNLFPSVKAPPLVGEKHNALYDATFQAAHAQQIFNFMERKGLE